MYISVPAGKETKPDMTRATGTIVSTDTTLVVWVGSLLDGPSLMTAVVNGLEKCLNALRGSGLQAAAPGSVNYAEASFITESNHMSNIEIGTKTTPVSATSNGIAIYVGALFQPTPSASITTAVKRAVEKYKEEVQKPNVLE